MISEFRKILFLVHSLPPYEFTGTPNITLDYARILVKKGYHVAVIYPTFEDAEFRDYRKVIHEEGFTAYEVPFTEAKWIRWSIFDVSYMDRKREEKCSLLMNILLDFNPDLVHVVDNVNLPSEWIQTIYVLGIPILRQVCNYEDVCGRIEPFRSESLELCELPISLEQCTDCCLKLCQGGEDLIQTENRLEIFNALSAKREHNRYLYEQIYSHVIFSNNSFKDHFIRTFEIPSNKISIIERGLSNIPENPISQPGKEDGITDFIFLGNLTPRKGISLIRDVFLSTDLMTRNDYNLNIYGSGDSKLVAELVEKNPRVRFHGPYKPEDLHLILPRYDIGLSPSFFETYHKVTREYLIYGLPVIGSTAFGVPDIVKDGINGFIFKAGDLNGLKEKILKVLDDKGLLPKLKLNIDKSQIQTVENEVDEIIKKYNEIYLNASRPKLIYNTVKMLDESIKKTEKENKQLQQKLEIKEAKLQFVEFKLSSIQNNLTWRLLNHYIFKIFDRWLIPFGSRRRIILEKFSRKSLKGISTKKYSLRPGKTKQSINKAKTDKKLEPGKHRFAIYSNASGNYFFTEIRDLIGNGLRELGYSVDAVDEKAGFKSDVDWHIVVAPHEFFYLGDEENLCRENVPENLILVNTEQPSTQWFSLTADYFPQADYIWDINYDSANRISKEGFQCEFLPLGFAADCDLFQEIKQLPENYGTYFLNKDIKQYSYLDKPFVNRPIDISFIGCLTPRREEFFAKAASTISSYRSYIHFSDGLSAPVVPGITTHMNTETVVGLMQRSKIMLNVHHGSDNYFEWHRIVILGIGQRTLVISEPSISSPIFQPGIHYVEAKLKDIPEKMKYYLSNPIGIKEAQEIIERGHTKLKAECRLADFLSPLISQLYVPKSQS